MLKYTLNNPILFLIQTFTSANTTYNDIEILLQDALGRI